MRGSGAVWKKGALTMGHNHAHGSGQHRNDDGHSGGLVVHDSWFRHEGELPPQYEHGAHVKPKLLGVMFIALALAVAGTMVIVILYYNSHMTRVKSEMVETTEPAEDWYRTRLSAEQAQRESDRLRSAMDRVVTQYAGVARPMAQGFGPASGPAATGQAPASLGQLQGLPSGVVSGGGLEPASGQDSGPAGG